MDVLVVFVLWIGLAFVVGEIAARKGRSVGGWFVFALLLSPLIAGLLLLFMPADESGLVGSGKYRKCPKCAELVRAEASICRHCHSSLADELESVPVGAPLFGQPDQGDRAFNRSVFIVAAILILAAVGWIVFGSGILQ